MYEDSFMEEYQGRNPWFHFILLEIFRYTSSLLKKNDISFWLGFGTLLGAIRNGKIIPWDNDIDIGMWHQDVHKLFEIESQILQDGFQLQITNDKNHIRIIRIFHPLLYDFHVDIFPWLLREEEAYCIEAPRCFCSVVDLQVLSEIDFEGEKYPCAQNPEIGLLRFYGSDWMTPKVNSSQVRFIEHFDKSNQDILLEIKKFGYYD